VAEGDLAEPRVALGQLGDVPGDRVVDRGDAALADGDPDRADSTDLAIDIEVWTESGPAPLK